MFETALNFQYCDQMVDCSGQCVIWSSNNETTVLYLSILEHTYIIVHFLQSLCMSQFMFVDVQVKAFVGIRK